MAGRTYIVGRRLRVRVEGHDEPVSMIAIEITGMCAGGGVMLIADRGNGEADRIVDLLNKAETPTGAA